MFMVPQPGASDRVAGEQSAIGKHGLDNPAMNLRIEQLRNTWAGPFTLSIDKGTCLTVTGASGSGKSVFLRMLADMDATDGKVFLGDDDRAAMPAPQWRQKVMLVPAQAGWWALTVDEHFDKKNKAMGTELARRLQLPDDIFGRQILRLSTGERQRLALIRALVARPAALLLDEPTSSLDQQSVAAVESVLANELERGLILILVTHDPVQADRMGNQTLHIKDGKVAST